MSNDPGDDNFEKPSREERERFWMAEGSRHNLPDSLLHVFVHLANTTGIEMSVSMHIGGSVVSGTLVGVKTYRAALLEQIKGASGENADQFAEGLRQAFDSLNDDESNEDDEDDDLFSPLSTWIHLINAKIIMGGATTFDPKVWRGRLGQVDGWFMGA